MHFLSYSSKCIKKRWRIERHVRQILFYTSSFTFLVFLGRLLEIARRRETIYTYIIDDTVIFTPSYMGRLCPRPRNHGHTPSIYTDYSVTYFEWIVSRTSSGYPRSTFIHISEFVLYNKICCATSSSFFYRKILDCSITPKSLSLYPFLSM